MEGKTVRSLCAIPLACALVLRFAEAPLAHVHGHGGDADHHAAAQAHFHLHSRAPMQPGLVFERPDPADDVRMVDWFQTVEQTHLDIDLAPALIGVPGSFEPREYLSAPPEICGHDPPVVSDRESRAPPSIPA